MTPLSFLSGCLLPLARPCPPQTADSLLLRRTPETSQELGGNSGSQPAARRVQLLEVSQYLEAYLWPNFDGAAASWEHVMSIILMLNEKFREGVLAWGGLRSDGAKFEAFFQRFLRFKVPRLSLNPPVLPDSSLSSSSPPPNYPRRRLLTPPPGSSDFQSEREVTPVEKLNYLLFCINVFQSLEQEMVRSQASGCFRSVRKWGGLGWRLWRGL